MKRALVIGIICLLLLPLAMAEAQGQQQMSGNSDLNAEDEADLEDNMDETQIPEPNLERKRIQEGTYEQEGKRLEVQYRDNNRVRLSSENVDAETNLYLEEQTQAQDTAQIRAKLSNGKYATIKVMPDTASERAIYRLRLKACSEETDCKIELKEVGQGEQTKAAYELQARREVKVLGLFKTKMQVQAHVDAETGEVIQTKKPWWAFLASDNEVE